jgi:hypothetical protein
VDVHLLVAKSIFWRIISFCPPVFSTAGAVHTTTVVVPDVLIDKMVPGTPPKLRRIRSALLAGKKFLRTNLTLVPPLAGPFSG